MTSEWHQPYSERWAHSPHSASRSALWHAAFPGFQGAQSTDWHSGPFCRLPCIWPCERGIRPKWDSHLGFFVFGVELGETSLDTDPAERGPSSVGCLQQISSSEFGALRWAHGNSSFSCEIHRGHLTEAAVPHWASPSALWQTECRRFPASNGKDWDLLWLDSACTSAANR